MLLVAIDTSGRHGSVALCRAEPNSFEFRQQMLEGGTYSARLIPVIADLLARQSANKHDVDAFVVVSGPGSFTGLRVGIATVKGLCEVLQKPLVAVSMLEVVAVLRSTHDGRVTVALDAGRAEVYVGEFEVSGDRAALIREDMEKLASFADAAAAKGLLVLTPDSKVADSLFNARVNVEIVEPVHAGEIGELGYRKLLAGELSDPATLDANYIRRSDAELFSPLSGDAVLIRAAVPGDIPRMRELAEQSPTAAHWSAREYEALLAPEAPARVALVACEAVGVIRGFVIARCGVEECEIENVVVDPKLRRQGIGRRLMRGILRRARESNVATIILEVRESNAAARALYANFGFHEEGRRRAYYRNPEEDAVVLRMTL